MAIRSVNVLDRLGTAGRASSGTRTREVGARRSRHAPRTVFAWAGAA